MIDWIAILADPIPSLAALEFVADASAGGTAVFLGATRADKNAAGHELLALEYEAYEAMALEQLQDLAGRVRRKWPILKLVLMHRIGRVAVGEASVLIAVSAAHRAEAFEACRFLIDTLKAQAAIWKKQLWCDGSVSWPASLNPDS